MKTVIEKRDDLYDKYIPNRVKMSPIFDSEIKSKPSCFYDYGVRREVGFGEIITPIEDEFEDLI